MTKHQPRAAAHRAAVPRSTSLRVAVLSAAVLCALFTLVPGCSPTGTQGERIVPADIVLLSGKVITVDSRDRIVEAVAIRGNRIVAVGSDRELERWIGLETEVLDLGGRTVVPGFIDAHNHVEHTARFLHFLLNVHSPPLGSSAEVLEKVAQKAAELPAGAWIVGQGTYGQT
ncbi:MAG: amidohydrolase family protein, partial [Acidobacteriota bacterium]